MGDIPLILTWARSLARNGGGEKGDCSIMRLVTGPRNDDALHASHNEAVAVDGTSVRYLTGELGV